MVQVDHTIYTCLASNFGHDKPLLKNGNGENPTRGNMNEKHLSLKYVAGLVDGEGCIDVYQGKVKFGSCLRPRVRIALTKSCKYVLEALQKDWGGYIYDRKAQQPNQADSASWELVGYKQVIPFLAQIYNFMLIKKEQARLVLWLASKVKSQWIANTVRSVIKQEMSTLKHDPHRLSEEAQSVIENAMRCDSQVAA